MTNLTTPNTAANGGQILTEERILGLAKQVNNSGAGLIDQSAAIAFYVLIEADLRAALAAPASPTVDRNAAMEGAADAPKLSVWYGAMPESNGKSNFTAILHAGDIVDGITLDRSEYPDRVRYEADRARHLIGELEARPFILDYDANKRSNYVAPEVAQPAAQGAVELDAARYRWFRVNHDRYVPTGNLPPLWEHKKRNEYGLKVAGSLDAAIDVIRVATSEQSTDKSAEKK